MKFTLTLDASQINSFQTCPLEWWYRYRENLRLASGRNLMEAADKGTLVHTLLDFYYNFRWIDPKGNNLLQANEIIRVFKEQNLIATLFGESKETQELEQFLCERFMLYVQRYMFNDFTLPTTKVSPVELGFSKLLYEDEDVCFIVEGRIDLINIVLGDKLVFTDHKSQSKVQSLYDYRPQFKTYAWATGYEYGMINYFGLQEDKDHKILKAGNMFRRQLIHFPKWVVEEWEQKMLNIFWTITHLTLNKSKDSSEHFIYHTRNDSACEGVFGHPCSFTSLCETNWDMKQQIKEFKYNKVESWSPWRLNEVKK